MQAESTSPLLHLNRSLVPINSLISAVDTYQRPLSISRSDNQSSKSQPSSHAFHGQSLQISYQASFPIKERSRSLSSTKEWICKFEGCGVILKSKSSRFRHQRQHLNPETQYSCSFEGCDAKYLLKLDLVDHERKSHMDKSKYVACNICERTFSSISNLNAHKEMHHKENAHKEMHHKDNHEKPRAHPSSTTTENSGSPSLSYNNTTSIHKRNPIGCIVPNYSCSICPQVEGIIELRSHMRNHYNVTPPISSSDHYDDNDNTASILHVECGLCDKILKIGNERVSHWEAAHFVGETGVCLVNGCGHFIKHGKKEWVNHIQSRHSSLYRLM